MENIQCKIEIVDTNIATNEAIKQPSISKQNKTVTIPKNSLCINMKNPFHCSMALNHRASSKINLYKNKTHLHCNHCDYFSVKSNLIVQHTNTKIDELYSCHSCVFSTKCLKKLKNHQRFCTTKMCPICSYITNNYDLNQHIQLHSNNKCYNCNHCGYLCIRKSQLQEHICIKHDQIKKFVCDQCARVFGRASDLREHYKINLTCSKKISFINVLRTYQPLCKLYCNHCEYSTLDSNLISQQTKVKKNELYQCHTCVFSTECLKKLKIHQKSHLEKRYMCHMCSYTTNKSSNFKKHMPIHGNVKSYRCNHCEYSCKRNCHFQDHICIKHDQIKRFVCEKCARMFGTAHSLREHSKIFHNPPIHKCDKCEYANGHKSYLYRHKRRFHKSNC